jgi:acyl carrier protein
MTIDKAELQDLLSQVFGLGGRSVTLESGPEEIKNWDSLNHLNMIAAVEDHFKFSFSGEEISSIYCVGDLVSIIRDHGVDVAW